MKTPKLKINVFQCTTLSVSVICVMISNDTDLIQIVSETADSGGHMLCFLD